ncbi:MAG TPA: nitrilase-related carbon-nitrogen hydrolase [Bacteroidota bacterium]|nr:nitrilase-related carbon-nitrogen hydrolase [Bacteroidota bacterium]
MRLAIVQTRPEFGSTRANLQSAIELMESERADLYVLPELFNTGYNFIDTAEVESVAERTDGPTFQAIARFAKDRACYVAYGFAEKTNRLFNSAALVGPDGLIGLYRKIHLFDRETLLFEQGDLGFPVFDLPFGRVGMMICFDWIYPESARSLALQGAQLVLHPSNLVLPYCPDAMVTRCLESRVFSATANRVGTENRGGVNLRFIGTSEVVSPRGEIMVRLEREEPAVGVVEVDLAEARSKRINQYNDLLAGRRPDQYTS